MYILYIFIYVKYTILHTSFSIYYINIYDLYNYMGKKEGRRERKRNLPLFKGAKVFIGAKL